MPQIVRLFHGSQIVHDVLEVGRFYHDFFGSWVYEAQHLVPEGCVNSANLLGGNFSMELLAPLDPAADTTFARQLRRRGPHFNNIAFWVKDCRGLAQQLIERGIRVALRGHGVVQSLPEGHFDYAITHPKDTCGSTLELLEDQPIHDPRDRPWWTSSFWRDRHPLGIEGLSHCTVAVHDLVGASRFYSEILGCAQLGDEQDARRGWHRRSFSIADTRIELIAATSEDSELARHLASHGPGVYGFSFRVVDLARAKRHAQEHGFSVREIDPESFELDPQQTFGGVFCFEQSSPRGGSR